MAGTIPTAHTRNRRHSVFELFRDKIGTMQKLTCPHCKKPGISVIRKTFLGPVLPARCSICHNRVGVSIKWSALVILVYAAVLLSSPLLALLFLPLAIFVYVKWVPLIPL